MSKFPIIIYICSFMGFNQLEQYVNNFHLTLVED